MAVLEQAVIKDNTLLPGEWYRGNCTSRRRPTRAELERATRSSSPSGPIGMSSTWRKACREFSIRSSHSIVGPDGAALRF